MNKKMYQLGSCRSVIRDLFEYGKELKKQIGEENVFDFTLGNPSVACPKEVNDYAVWLLQNDKAVHAYSSSQGDYETRKAICDYNEEKYGFKLNPNLIYMTCGAAAALKIVIGAIVSKSEEVLAIAPFFPEYRVFAETCGAKFNYVKCDEKDFLIDFTALENNINENTRIVIINSPNNPSGSVYDEETIKKLAKILSDKQAEYKKPIYLVTDEPYREILFDGAVCPFICNYYDNSIICYSYSKALSLPGERIGYIALSPNLDNASELYLAVLGSGRAYGYVCAPSLYQKVIAKNVKKLCDMSVYKDNRDILIGILTKLNFKCVNPKGAFYLFVKSPISDANAFSEEAKKHGLLLVPSNSFGVEGYVRVATCVSKEVCVRSEKAFTSLAKVYNLI